MPVFIEQRLKRNCGQIAVAALTEAPLEKVVELIGHKRGTKTRALVTALRALGYSCPDRCYHTGMVPDQAFGLGQMREQGRKTGWHWVAIANGYVFDGYRSGPLTLEAYQRYIHATCKGRITSFLPVTR